MSFLDILNPNLILRVRLVVYGVLIFFSFFIFVGVAVMKDKAKGCPLYWSASNVLTSDSNCNYPMAIAIMFQLLYLLFRMVILILLLLGKFTTDMFFFSDLLELIYTVLDLVTFFLTFIGACILSAGTNSTCSDHRVLCDGQSWHSASKAAQAGAWISTFAWLFVGVIGAIYLFRAGKIPFLSGGAAASTGQPTDGGPPPTIDTPPNHPDDMPKY